MITVIVAMWAVGCYTWVSTYVNLSVCRSADGCWDQTQTSWCSNGNSIAKIDTVFGSFQVLIL